MSMFEDSARTCAMLISSLLLVQFRSADHVQSCSKTWDVYSISKHSYISDTQGSVLLEKNNAKR
jgi:hypothetical protein